MLMKWHLTMEVIYFVGMIQYLKHLPGFPTFYFLSFLSSIFLLAFVFQKHMALQEAEGAHA